MITLGQIVSTLQLEVAAGAEQLDREVNGGYASDLLSYVMGRAKKGNVWVTLQSHVNIVAVATVAGLAAIIVTEGSKPDTPTLAKAEEEQIPILRTPKTTFSVVSELAALGVSGTD